MRLKVFFLLGALDTRAVLGHSANARQATHAQFGPKAPDDCSHKLALKRTHFVSIEKVTYYAAKPARLLYLLVIEHARSGEEFEEMAALSFFKIGK